MRRLASLSLIVSVFGALAFAGPASAVTVGISDQQASTFFNPLFAPLKIKTARYVAPYDVMFNATQHGNWDAWYKAATAVHQKILVSFEHSRTSGKEQSTPTVGQYQTAMKAFHTAYPTVKLINTWNEVNACQKGTRTERQPRGICKASKAKLLAQYYGVSRAEFPGATIIPVDVLDDRGTNPKAAIDYIKAFKKASKKQPSIWGLHNYSDTNRFSQVRTKAILKAIGPNGKVWLLETGGQLSVFGGSESTKAKQAAKALGCMFYIAKQFKQIKELFVYQFNGAKPGATFDAGLININNTVRPGYAIVKSHKSRKCG
jgi:hypothetical protein